MEMLGYVISRNFALIAVNVRHVAKVGPDKIEIPNARKAYVIRDNLLLAMRGNPYKITDIKKYLLKLSELNSIKSFHSVRDDLNDVFNTAQDKMSVSIAKINKVIGRLKRDDGYIDTREVEKNLDSREEIMLLRDIASATLNDHNSLTILSLFGYEQSKGLEMVHMVAAGSQISDVYKSELPEDQIFLQFLSDSTVDAIALQNELVKKLIPFLPAGWHKDNQQIAIMLEQAKEVLMIGFTTLSPPDDQPNIIFYELSPRTGFIFNEPPIPLVNIEYNYNRS